MKWLKECVLPVLMFCGTAKVMLNWRKAAHLQKKATRGTRRTIVYKLNRAE